MASKLSVTVAVLVLLAPVVGCSALRTTRSRVQTPAGAILSQSGAAAVPAAVNSTQTITDVPLPKGSTVRIDPDGAVSVTVTEAATFHAAASHESATAAASFAPPSELDLAKGFNVRLWGAAGLALAVLALGLALRGHLKAAAIAGAGAVVVPLVGHFVNSTAGLVLAGICIAASVALFAAWHLMRLSRSATAAPALDAASGVSRVTAPASS